MTGIAEQIAPLGVRVEEGRTADTTEKSTLTDGRETVSPRKVAKMHADRPLKLQGQKLTFK